MIGPESYIAFVVARKTKRNVILSEAKNLRTFVRHFMEVTLPSLSREGKPRRRRGGVSQLCTIALVFYCTIALRAAPDSTKSAQVRDLTLQGLDKAYNFEFAAAEKLFDAASTLDPPNPRPQWGKVEINFWKTLIARRDSNYDQFLNQADRVIDKAEKYLDTYGRNTDILNCLGTLYGDRAFANARMKNYLRAAWDGKKSYDYFADAYKLDPSDADAYAGLGIYHYFASFIPKSLQWIVSILGVRSDNALGIRQLGFASERASYLRVQSQYYLAELLPWQTGEFDSSEAIFKNLHAKFPRNTLFNFTLGAWEMRRNAVADAKARFLGILADSDLVPGLRDYTVEKLGECSFRLADYPAAARYYGDYLRHHTDNLYVASSRFRLGICREMLGERDSALVYYSSAAREDDRFGDDAYCVRRAELRRNNPLQTDDSLLLRAQSFYKTGRYDSAVVAFSELRLFPGVSSLNSAEALYGRGDSFFELGAYDSALADYQSLIVMKLPERERWLSAISYYQIGLCFKKIHKNDLAAEAFRKTLEFNDYDYENWYSHRANRELELLKKSG